MFTSWSLRICLGLALGWAAAAADARGAAAAEQASAAEYRVPWDELKKVSQDYLAAHCTAEQLLRMDQKLTAGIQQKLADNANLTEDSAMRTIMLDFAAGSERRIRKRQAEAVQWACFYMIQFVERGFALPWQIRERMTKKVCDDLQKQLRSEIEKTLQAKSSPAGGAVEESRR